MPPKAKKAQKPSAGPVDGKGHKSAATTTATAPAKTTPAGADDDREDAEAKATTGTGKPDQAAYHAEQDRIKADIDALQVKLVRFSPCFTYRLHLICTLCSRQSRKRSP